jgi:hypothetical protein
MCYLGLGLFTSRCRTARGCAYLYVERSESAGELERLWRLAAIHPVRSLTVKAQVTSPTQATVVADTQGMTRLDVYLSDRPIQSIDIQGGQATFTVTKPDAAQLNLEILGFDGIRLVARYRTSV